ncbi:nucleotide disphospho-sugar-binding domain-containing protein [Azospirillum halopraeferens]|uniref:nucleotide disphospho-sugar-binding domain-containing protein n=1 Tax=Azospirillum halopraeferens TaxID=34010 RepID=UPI0003FD6D97|nr:nucleotide disphospho-sugar-binding domain-containing protein [Azospirillum halopraeferens]
MARVLLAWELGDGFGHVTRLVPIARRLRDAGHDCVFAMRSLDNAHTVLDREGFRLVQAPFAVPRPLPGNTAGGMQSFGDILAAVGFADPPRLDALVTGWESLLDLLDIRLVVADYSPALCIAAFGRLPVINIGDGFVLPPGHLDHMPTFHDRPPLVPEERLVAAVRTVQERHGRPVPPNLPAILAGAGQFVVTLPELDFYGDRRREPAIGPLLPLPAPLERAPEEDYFGYLSLGYQHTRKVLDGLAASGRKGRIYLRDATPAQMREYRDKGLVIHDTPQPMREAVERAAVVVHHGGVGTVETVLALGRPQLIVPRHQEQRGNANALGRLKVAVSMRSGGVFEPRHVTEALAHLLAERSFRDNAAATARRLAAAGPSDALDRIIARCLELLD